MLFSRLRNRLRQKNSNEEYLGETPNVYCTNCFADLEKQPGYSADMECWECRSCGQLLVNPASQHFADSDIVWYCDGCGGYLNLQEGFSTEQGAWQCQKCGYLNDVSASNVYINGREYARDNNNPLKGLSDADILDLYRYEEVGPLKAVHTDNEVLTDASAGKVMLVRDTESGELYVKKVLDNFDEAVIRELYENPVMGIPRIVKLYRSRRYMIIIEEYIDGFTLEEMKDSLNVPAVLKIVNILCGIVSALHKKEPAIIHRDIKPSNIIISEEGLFLVDIDAAKKYSGPGKEDTVLLGTRGYAAPEQYGFGTSSEKTDIYAIGVLLNILVTGSFLGEKMADGAIGAIVKRCTKMDPEDRYESVEALMTELEGIA